MPGSGPLKDRLIMLGMLFCAMSQSRAIARAVALPKTGQVRVNK